MSFPKSRWRAPVTGAVTGMVVAAAVVGSSALASGGGTPAARTAADTGRAAIQCGAPASAGVKEPNGRSEGPGDAPFLAGVAQMVQAGTINQAQARALDADIRQGRIDTDQLVANGTLSSAQAQTVMDRLGAIKRSLAPGAQTSRDVKAAERKRSRH